MARVIVNTMGTLTIFNLFEVTGLKNSSYDQWFNKFLSIRVNKESNSQSSFRFLFSLWLDSFFPLDLSQAVP